MAVSPGKISQFKPYGRRSDRDVCRPWVVSFASSTEDMKINDIGDEKIQVKTKLFLYQYVYGPVPSKRIGDIDPRGLKEYCYTITDKARAIGGGVLEAIMHFYNVNNSPAGRQYRPTLFD